MINRRICLGAALAAPVFTIPCVSAAVPPQGRYVGELILRMLDDGRTAELVEPFAYVATDGRRWSVPRGARVDGASIPRLLWPLIGGPFEGRYRAASVIHDWYCDVRSRTWQDTHRVFREAMLTSGVERRLADLMYAAVRYRGPRWNTVAIHNTQLSSADVDALRRAISAGSDDHLAVASARDALGQVWIDLARAEGVGDPSPRTYDTQQTVDFLQQFGVRADHAASAATDGLEVSTRVISAEPGVIELGIEVEGELSEAQFAAISELIPPEGLAPDEIDARVEALDHAR